MRYKIKLPSCLESMKQENKCLLLDVDTDCFCYNCIIYMIVVNISYFQ